MGAIHKRDELQRSTRRNQRHTPEIRECLPKNPDPATSLVNKRCRMTWHSNLMR